MTMTCLLMKMARWMTTGARSRQRCTTGSAIHHSVMIGPQ